MGFLSLQFRYTCMYVTLYYFLEFCQWWEVDTDTGVYLLTFQPTNLVQKILFAKKHVLSKLILCTYLLSFNREIFSWCQLQLSFFYWPYWRWDCAANFLHGHSVHLVAFFAYKIDIPQAQAEIHNFVCVLMFRLHVTA